MDNDPKKLAYAIYEQTVEISRSCNVKLFESLTDSLSRLELYAEAIRLGESAEFEIHLVEKENLLKNKTPEAILATASKIQEIYAAISSN